MGTLVRSAAEVKAEARAVQEPVWKGDNSLYSKPQTAPCFSLASSRGTLASRVLGVRLFGVCYIVWILSIPQRPMCLKNVFMFTVALLRHYRNFEVGSRLEE